MSTNQRYRINDIRIWVEEQLTALSPKNAPSNKRRSRPSAAGSDGIERLPNFEAIRSGCGWIDTCCSLDRIPEPDWYALASIAGRCEDGEEIFHEISALDPRYDEAEASTKLDRALTAAGPRTCGRIHTDLGHAGCLNCPFFGEIRSPIELGALDPKIADLMRDQVFITRLRSYLDTRTGNMLSHMAFSDKYRHFTGNATPHFRLSTSRFTKKVDTLDYQPGIKELFIETETGESAVNVWKNDGVHPADGDPGTILAHFENLIPDQSFREHVLNCLAFLLQNPGEKIGHALLISGKQGTGKSLLFQLLRKLVGPTNHKSIESEQLSNRFTAQMTNVRLMTIEELMTFEKMEVYNRLKTWITDRSVRVEEKGIPFYFARTPDFIIGASEPPRVCRRLQLPNRMEP